MASHVHRDMQLLFGLLALHNGFVSREELVAATGVWLQDQSRGLAEILLEHGMPRDLHEVVGVLVSKHLEQHGGDPRPSLSALSSMAEFPDELTSWGSPDLDDMLACVSQSTRDKSASRDTVSWDADSSLHGGRGKHTRSSQERFRILRPHAKGGLGEVFVARDMELGRDVALKEIQPRFADHAVSRARFVQEAEITGSLEHPGIVPVYGLGQYPDGRPFYAMRFIQGDSLRDAIEAFHTSQPKNWSSGETLLKLRELLGRFIGVCNAMEYAHSRGVLHRDLKPGNIMLGKYGETLVANWGLAKAMGRSGGEPETQGMESTIRPSSMGESTPTEMGQVIGTAAYMSPEQASGRVDQIGRASDVYSLGATLYSLLTGRLAFSDKNVDVILEKVRQGDFLPPRRINARIPSALESICLRAMAHRPQDRYESPSHLVRDLERWLADESVLAHRESLGERLTRLGRRYKTAVRVAVMGLMAVATVATAAAWLINRQKNRAEQLAVEKQNLAVTNSRIAASERKAKESAQQAAERTQRVLDYLVSAFRKPDPEIDGRQVTVASILEQALRDANTQFADDPLERATLLNAIGRTCLGLGLFSTAIEAYERAVEIRHEKLGEAHPDTLISMGNLAYGYQEAGLMEKAIPLLEKNLLLCRTHLGEDHEETLKSMGNLAAGYSRIGQLDRAFPLEEETLTRTRKKFGENHEDTLRAMGNLAEGYHDAGQIERALELTEKTLQLKRANLGEDHPQTLMSMNNLAGIYQTAGMMDKALPLFEETLELMRHKLGDRHLDTLTLMNNLASAYYRMPGQAKKALALFEETLESTRANLGDDHPLTLMAMQNLAGTYGKTGQLDKALPWSEKCVELVRDKLGEEHPRTLIAISNLAMVYQETGRVDKALLLLEKNLKIGRQKFGPDHPDTLASMNNLASGYESAGQLDAAVAFYEETLKLRSAKLGEAHPDTLKTLDYLHGACLANRQFDKAEPLIRMWLRALASVDPPDTEKIAWARTSLAEALLELDRLDEATEQVKLALEPRSDHRANSVLGGILTKQSKWNDAEPLLLDAYHHFRPNLAKYRPGLRWHIQRACERIITLYEAQGRTDEVAKWQAELAAIQPEIIGLRNVNAEKE